MQNGIELVTRPGQGGQVAAVATNDPTDKDLEKTDTKKSKKHKKPKNRENETPEERAARRLKKKQKKELKLLKEKSTHAASKTNGDSKSSIPTSTPSFNGGLLPGSTSSLDNFSVSSSGLVNPSKSSKHDFCLSSVCACLSS